VTFGLTYHDVAPALARKASVSPGRRRRGTSFRPEDFDRHLESIAQSGAGIGLLSDAARLRLPDVALTFDDGGASAQAVATSLERYGWKGHFFVTTSKIGAPGFLTPEALLELASAGHVIGSHCHTHPTYMGVLDRTSIDSEWNESRVRLGEILGDAPDIASVPGGFVTPKVIESAARAGYRILLTSEPRFPRRHAGALLVLGRYSILVDDPCGNRGEIRAWGGAGPLAASARVEGEDRRQTPEPCCLRARPTRSSGRPAE
jgi:peptidoglycan/xylan/chitin deacetylase (PgdA/CDA1 family)